MKKRNTVYEDEQEKRDRQLREHTVSCPHCGNPVLDHLTECPHCKGKLTPRGYQPLSDEKIKKIRIVTYSIGVVVAIVVIVLIFMFRK